MPNPKNVKILLIRGSGSFEQGKIYNLSKYYTLLLKKQKGIVLKLIKALRTACFYWQKFFFIATRKLKIKRMVGSNIDMLMDKHANLEKTNQQRHY